MEGCNFVCTVQSTGMRLMPFICYDNRDSVPTFILGP